MEVHTHTHTPEPGVHPGRKKWTHYLWEFLMLFLAVFCGFLAENQREHYVEHQREKKLMRSLASDLTADIARLNSIVQQRNNRALMLDSFVLLLNKTDAESFSRYLYYFNSFATRSHAYRFTPVDGTMQQLKNAGNLRLIRKTAVSDSIIAYDVATRALLFGSNDEEGIIDTYRDIAEGVFDGRELSRMRDEDNSVFMLPYDPPLRFNTEALFRLNYRLHMLIVFNRTLRRESRAMKRKAEALLALIKAEYHLSEIYSEK
jgi:hypothetical protein